MQGEEIGRRAVEEGLLTPAQLDEALAARPPQLGEYLAAKGLITWQDLRRLKESARPRVPEPARDQAFGKYTLRREVGRGGMSVVWEAIDNELGRRVALKLLRGYRAGAPNSPGGVDEEAFRRFIREAQTAAKLQHPNVVKVYEAGAWEGIYYIAMEYVEGITLADATDKKRLTLKQAARTLRDSARAIHYAHGQGVLHRDIKPQNIMINERGETTVMDFGLALDLTTRDRLTLSGIAIGTPSYMSPEHAQGSKHEHDPRSDVYSLGAVLYDAITGRPPFGGPTPMAVMLAVVNEEALLPRSIRPECPSDLEVVCMMAMDKDKGRRYPTAADFADDLDRFLQGEAIRAKPPSVLYRARKKVVKHRGVAAALALTLLALGGWGGYVFVRGQRDLARVAEYLARAQQLEAQGEFTRAIEVYDALVLVDPEHAGGRQGRRRCFDAERERTERQEAAADALARGKELQQKRDFLGAVEEYTRALGARPDLAEAYHQRGHSWEALQQPERAAEDIARALSLDAANPELWVEVGTIKRRAKDYDAAREHYDKAVAIKPTYAEGHHQLAHLHLDTGDVGRQEDALRRAAELDPQNPEFLRELGDNLGGRGRHGEAVEWYQRAVDRNPHYVDAYHNMGHAQIHLGKADAAVKSFTLAIRHGPRGKFYVDRAEAHLILWRDGRDPARLDQAVSDATACIQTEPGMARAWLVRARAHRARGAFERARADYLKARELDRWLEGTVSHELGELDKEGRP